VKNDASIGEDYAPVGYYGDYEIRGFTIDLATGSRSTHDHRREQDVPLENKERVEFSRHRRRGSGVASAGGLIDYVTSACGRLRPQTWPPIIAARVMVRRSWTSFGTATGGARVNLAGEISRVMSTTPMVARGGRGRGRLEIGPKAILKGDFEYQHKVERSVCAISCLGGTTVPISAVSSTMLGGSRGQPILRRV